ncbi:CAIB/BAIF family enzyme [Aspergillus clavatus NRRL 1]|uniref:CAIB/BAIF family enzyme n=1 Tax=Aspergillus clavatus (strain ATCC 1007 / CBS 513.65 / DSM 816 / NCTC 3887 / NRRL 1 / QM 1276 / 107) TaxID=344612 RepID=A1CK36_ASPCL|nr:CAIB/BAIF family enzyme [Aspergillus clavatus NRRL 1]EAW09510.1 CAIB/BAIF family enzyme [Aspergillus clavatus NRRL 1]
MTSSQEPPIRKSVPDRTSFTARDSVEDIWKGLGLPPEPLQALDLTGSGPGLPSSFKIADLAQASIGLSGLLAAHIHALRTSTPTPKVTVPREHAVIEFKSERLYTLAGQPASTAWGPLSGLHKTSDGHVRVHDGFPHHSAKAKALLGCKPDADRAAVSAAIAPWRAVDLETAAFNAGAVIAALRTPAQWDVLPQARAVADFPIRLRRIDGEARPVPVPVSVPPPGLPPALRTAVTDKALRGLRVLELSRVIAAPLAGKTLAAHGADVLWVTSPTLPDLPPIDREFGRGKRTVQLDLATETGAHELARLLDDAHVFIQGFRPGSVAARGFSAAALAARRARSNGSGSGRGIICANFSAYGRAGPWADRRGFDSLVQTCSGMNESEALHFGAGEAGRATACQVLDHAGGYFLAAGVMAAVCRQAEEGGSWEVDVSLAGVMKYLRSLGQYDGRSGFDGVPDYQGPGDVPEEYLETRETGFGEMRFVRHAACIEGVEVGWDVMVKPLGEDEKRWL